MSAPLFPEDSLESLYAYDRWATERMLRSVRAVSAVDYVRELGGGWPSIRGTLVHLAGATDAWATRFSGAEATRLPTVDELPAFGDAEALLLSAGERLRALVPAFSPERLAGPFTWTNLSGAERTAPLWSVVRHAVNHGTYHRGQIASMVKRVGGTPLATDMVFWGIEASGGGASR